MPKIHRDPLVHFLLVGAALFAFLAWRNGDDGADPERIVIDAARVAELRDSARVLYGREPTAEELDALVEPLIREEVLYREALALGLDVNDDEVRRRLVEKMEYLSLDLADPEPKSEDELRAFYAAEPARFTRPDLVTYEQIYFSPGARGAALEADVAAALDALRAGADAAAFGDRTPLSARYVDAPRRQVEVLFGAELADAVFAAEAGGGWQGPFGSDFGRHLVRVTARTPSRLPPYDEIADEVRAEFAAERRRIANEAEYARLRGRYDVRVEAPAADDGADL